jgi:hypothetical protein
LPRPPSGGLSFGRVGFANTADVSIVTRRQAAGDPAVEGCLGRFL